MKNTTITIKVSLLIFSLSALIITQKNHCMESNFNNFSSTEQALILACNEMRDKYQKHCYSPIQATITLNPNSCIGYGNQFCINALNSANIPTNQYQPLILANIQTQNTDEPYKDLTKTLPLTTRKEIVTIHEELFATTEKSIKSLYPTNTTPEEMKRWRHFLEISNHINEHYKTLINQVIPAFIPVHILFSSVIKIKLFKAYPTTFLFDGQQQLSQLLIKFYKIPQTITMINAKTIKTINKRNRLLTLNAPERENEIMLLNDEIDSECIIEALETNKELEDAHIIHFQNPFNNSLTDVSLTENHILCAPLLHHTHGINGSTKEKERNDCFNNELLATKMLPLINFLNHRAITGK